MSVIVLFIVAGVLSAWLAAISRDRRYLSFLLSALALFMTAYGLHRLGAERVGQRRDLAYASIMFVSSYASHLAYHYFHRCATRRAGRGECSN